MMNIYSAKKKHKDDSRLGAAGWPPNQEVLGALAILQILTAEMALISDKNLTVSWKLVLREEMNGHEMMVFKL